jgi:K+-transporting ATPase KdpF subunit
MRAENAVLLLVTAGLMVYLFAAMLWPERF